MAKLFVFDTETTGLNFWQHGIHQLAGCIEIDGEVKEYFEFNIQPHPATKIDEEALSISGIITADLVLYESQKSVYSKLIEIMSKYVDRYNKLDKFFLVGYNNASFDNPFFRAFFKQCGDIYFGSWFWSSPIDVFILASQYLMNERHLMENFQQGTVAKYLGIEVDNTQLHTAVYDVEILLQIYKKVTNKLD